RRKALHDQFDVLRHSVQVTDKIYETIETKRKEVVEPSKEMMVTFDNHEEEFNKMKRLTLEKQKKLDNLLKSIQEVNDLIEAKEVSWRKKVQEVKSHEDEAQLRQRQEETIRNLEQEISNFEKKLDPLRNQSVSLQRSSKQVSDDIDCHLKQLSMIAKALVEAE